MEECLKISQCKKKKKKRITKNGVERNGRVMCVHCSLCRGINEHYTSIHLAIQSVMH